MQQPERLLSPCILAVLVVGVGLLVRPYGLIVLAPTLLVGGIIARRRSSNAPRMRAVAAGALTGGVVSLLVLIFFVAYGAFATSVHQKSGVEVGTVSSPITHAPTLTPPAP
ncbi:MAG: hypothetical protein ACR2M3_06860 [Thermomicrobiales bacterium]